LVHKIGEHAKMAKNAQAGQTRWTRRLTVALAFSLALATGCSQTPTASTQPHDPLHGVLTPPGLPHPTSAPKTLGTPTSLPQTNNQSFAPAGSDLSSTNNATMAGLSIGRPVAHDEQGRALPAGQLTSGSRTQQTPVQPMFPPYNPNPRVERVPDANPTSATLSPSTWQTKLAPTGVEPVANVIASEEALKRQLEERGVYHQKIDRISRGIILTCYVARAGQVRVLHNFEPASDYATAAQAILQQLNQP
jgi:hypothetical protein